MHSIYLDSNASTPLAPEVLTEIQEAYKHTYSNPHSNDHSQGWAAGKHIDVAREQVANLIGCDSDEIIFTSGATEANNLALLGFCRHVMSKYSVKTQLRDHLIVSSIEHKCVLNAANQLEQEGWKVSHIPVTADGEVDLQKFKNIISDRTALVSVMAVNNEIGTIQPIHSIANICGEYGSVFHTDAAQAPLAMQLNVIEQDIGFLSLSSHKIHGPKGIGALYIRRELQTQIKPIMFGGGQESGLRPGTLPTPLCIGFGIASELIAKNNSDFKKVAALRDHFLNRLQSQFPACLLNGSLENRHPGNLSVRFTGIDANRLIGKLQPLVALSTGSACTTGIPEPSHVLSAIGLTLKEAEETIRIGLNQYTKTEDADTAIELIIEAVNNCYSTVA